MGRDKFVLDFLFKECKYYYKRFNAARPCIIYVILPFENFMFPVLKMVRNYL